MSWSQVPEPPERSPMPLLVLWLVVTVPVWMLVDTWYFGQGTAVAAIAVVTAFLVAVVKAPRAIPAWVVLATMGMLLLSEVQPPGLRFRLAFLTLTPVLAWTLATGRVDPPYRWLPPTKALRPLVVPAAGLAACQFFRAPYRLTLAAALAIVAVGVAALIAPTRMEALVDRVEARSGRLRAVVARLGDVLAVVGRVAGEVIGALIMVPVAIGMALLWLVHRAFGYDPLQPQGADGPTWSRRAGTDSQPGRLYSAAPRFSRISPRRRRRAVAANGVATLGLAALGVWLFVPSWLGAIPSDVPSAVEDRLSSALPERCSAGPDAAMDQDPGWPDVLCETGDFSLNGRFDAVTTYTMADYESEHIEVVDGVRTSWRAPACDCERVSMWLFGGSAAFGWWQTTDVTIASRLAQRAWEDGIALDIDVRAMPGWVIGQEARLFGHLLGSVPDEEVPDLAMFYDGGNDLNRQKDRNSLGRGADESETSYAEEEINTLLAEGPFPWNAGDFEVTGLEERGPELAPGDVADHAMERYERGKALAEVHAEAAGVETLFVWQPLLPSSGREAGNEGAVGDDAWPFWVDMLDVALDRLPPDVLDLSQLFAGVDEPVFKDIFHPNAASSEVIADALYDELEPTLRAASTSG